MADKNLKLRTALLDWLCNDRELNGKRIGYRKFATYLGISDTRIKQLLRKYDDPNLQLEDIVEAKPLPPKSSYEELAARVLSENAMLSTSGEWMPTPVEPLEQVNAGYSGHEQPGTMAQWQKSEASRRDPCRGWGPVYSWSKMR